NLVTYLEGLVARAYLRIYGAREGAATAFFRFFGRHFPALVRELRWGVALSLALLMLGIAAGYALTLDDLDRYSSLVPAEIAQGRTPTSPPEELLAVLKEGEEIGGDRLAAFASFLFTHNSRVGMLCFALGPAAGAPVVLLLFGNGLMLGAMAAVYRVHDLGLEFWAWVLPHGVTELLAIGLCGGAGLALGRAVVLPGRYGRLHELAREGQRAAAIVAGAVAMFLVAALLEGFFRQLVSGEAPRYAVAVATGAFWWWYFLRPEGDRRPGR
ncbi:MAG TPA: stage II sporulation protein M, partial [Thermoanaerobaculia bacterium]|nr:stage II sporulation protein M [Thermoanaerobaculia bacterium]